MLPVSVNSVRDNIPCRRCGNTHAADAVRNAPAPPRLGENNIVYAPKTSPSCTPSAFSERCAIHPSRCQHSEASTLCKSLCLVVPFCGQAHVVQASAVATRQGHLKGGRRENMKIHPPRRLSASTFSPHQAARSVSSAVNLQPSKQPVSIAAPHSSRARSS
ncbi:hypothetical protein Caka_1000 [Coraliomargarita akajimensis DSM 45221]|uniref:Uncharacterized protein n=1 Tax=Coraliomargarita akajimensis (strain DSM 45221 / IAM 15411 / JCM 23193 / KCTC 12865 / 04OKA010-24) TaxID=583355 RepID=D5ER29_CORAD|nr:hypothetical protein Caka_1000 [Coraliomargarita akajimensis DSM 45221]